MTSFKVATHSQQDLAICSHFLQSVFHSLPPDANIFTSILTNEGAFPFIPLDKLYACSTDSQYYFCTMSVHPDEEGKIRRQDKNFEALHVIVLDDVGTKAQPNSVIPSYVIESSPGNFQWGYILEHPITDYVEANRIMRSIALNGKLSDKATNSCNRVVRLPLGINGKEGDKKLHKVRLVTYEPDRRFDPYKLLVEWDVSLDDARRLPSHIKTELADGVSSEEALDTDVLYNWLVQEGRVYSSISPSGFVKVDCPRASEHSVMSYAGYSPLGYGDNPGRRVFKCFHSHESGGGAPDTAEYLEWTKQEGAPYCEALGDMQIIKPRAYITVNPKTEVPNKSLQNCILMLEELGHEIKYDVMNDKVIVDGTQLHDVMLSRMIIAIGNVWHVQFTSQMVYDAVLMMAHDNSFHSVQDYLVGAEVLWDGVPRAEELFIKWMHVADTRAVRAMTRKWLLGCCYRAMVPGYKFDHALLLIGEEGTGKSSIFRALAGGQWFGELTTLDGKAAVENLMGVWICEFGEMNIASKHSQDELKQFLSRTSDRFRPAYGKVTVEYPRMSAFCGTTNKYKALDDIDGTGNRRFWPLISRRERSDTYDWKAFAQEVELIWGEVMSWYLSGESTDLPKDILFEVVAARAAITREDEWEGLIYEWLERVSDVAKMSVGRVHSVGRMHIAVECLGISPDKYTRAHGSRIAAIMDRHPNWLNNGTTPIYDKGFGNVKGWKLNE